MIVKVILIIAFTILTLLILVIWYIMKFTLDNKGYDVNFFWWHFPDVPNMIKLIIKTKEKKEKRGYVLILLSLLMAIIITAGLFALSIVFEWL
ncbi:MAG: hypothetical protein ACNS62_21550, partial [Candidatus Cyclobacteriaceae bacterium M3_2C_046]